MYNMRADLQRRRAILFILACTAALSIHSFLSSSQRWVSTRIIEGTEDEFHRILYDIDGSDEDNDAELLAIPAFLLDDDESGNNDKISEGDEEGASLSTTSYAQLIDTNRPLPPYTIEDALQVSELYDDTFALLVYDPEDDAFHGMYSENHSWRPTCQRLMTSFRNIAYLLRKIFPERFRGTESDELVIPIGSGDYPMVQLACLEHYRKQANDPKTPKWYLKRIKDISCNDYLAPILQFSSVFRRPEIFPNMIDMPVPEPNHLACFEYWAENEEICEHLLPSLPDRGEAMMVYGKEFGIEWEDLIPQVVWRGTDFSYLSNASPLLHKAHFDKHLIEWPWKEQGDKEMRTNIIGGGLTAQAAASMKERVEEKRKTNPRGPFVAKNTELLKEFSKAAALKAMKDEYKSLTPRWKAVVLTAEAEADATGHDYLPWANMKFSNFVVDGLKVPTVGAEQYKEWENIDFATGQHMDLPELAHYKYHIDTGGGGGTTWSGTIEKLAMPGLLFHHLTPTKDYIYDYMKPWVHYVPVAADLSDLKVKYEWAESHPVKAKKIADEGTKLIRYLTSKEGFQDMFNKDMVEPLRRVIEAYQPISTIQEDKSWSNWKDAIDQIEGKDTFTPVIECRNPTLNLGSNTFFTQALELVCQEFRDKKRYFEFKGGNIGWTLVH